MSLAKLRNEFETAGTPGATILGSVLGTVIVLGPVTAVIALIGHWSRWLGLALSIPVVIGTFLTVVEVVKASYMLRAELSHSSSVAARYVIWAKLIEFGFFAGAVFILFRVLY